MTKFLSAPAYPWAQVIVYYTRLYGAQIVLLTILSAVTVYRKEMSCNHVYAEDETESRALKRARRTPRQGEDPPSVTFWDDPVWDDLEGAGNYCSGELLVAAVMKIWASLFVGCHSLSATTKTTNGHTTHTEDCGFLSKKLAPDVQVHILSYLHPRDVVSFACASRSCKRLVDAGDTSAALWKNLWYRDYAWILHSWEVGRKALRRSQETAMEVRFDKTFYFLFGESYLNYVLAGNNSSDCCLVGLHGHIYDLTPFLQLHPGSPDTLMAYAGRDATDFFEQIGHSVGARRTARSLCRVVDVSRNGGTGCGVRPTTNVESQDGLPPAVDSVTTQTDDEGRRSRRSGTLQNIRSQYDAQQEINTRRFSRRFEGNADVLSQVNVYFDPMCMEWRAWFTDVELHTTFVRHV